MALLSTAAELELVQAAKIRCLTSQEYRATAQGRQQRMAELQQITKEQERLEKKLAAEAGGDSMTSLGVYGGVE